MAHPARPVPVSLRSTTGPLAFLLVAILCSTAAAHQPAPRLLVAFSSYRERPMHPEVFFYEHDGLAEGKITGRIPTEPKRSDHQPALSSDGRLCALASEPENGSCFIQLWDRQLDAPLTLVGLNETPNAQAWPSISSDGALLCFETWSRAGSPGRWDLLLYDTPARRFVELPGLNSSRFDECKPAVSADGRWLAFTSNLRQSEALTDVMLYDRREQRSVPLDGLNSPHLDSEPAIDREGRLLAFVSDRPEGSGGRDVYLYDRQLDQLLPLPGLNSVGQEQSPCLSPDGRYIAFVSERLDGEGERDLYLYDRHSGRLLPTPGLNSPRDEADPCVIVLGGG